MSNIEEKHTIKEKTPIKEKPNQLFSPDNIGKMAVRFKIPVFPCRADKTPLIRDWQQKASYDPKKIAEWQKLKSLAFWGMPTNKFLALDLDGTNLGSVKEEWLNQNPYFQKTPSGGGHWPFKQPKNPIGNKVRFTGDFDIRGVGGYICLYGLLFTSFNTPENVPELPKDLLSLIGNSKTKTSWEKGSRNNTLFQKITQDLTQNMGRKIPDIIEAAKASGLPQDEIIRTSISGVKTVIEGDHGFDPGPSPNGQAPRPAASKAKEKNKKKPLEETPLLYTVPEPQPRSWFFGEKIFIEGRPNQFTGEGGIGKSTFCREYAYRYWQQGGTVVLFAQEDHENEDIAPWLYSLGPKFKPGNKIERWHVFTDWNKNPIEKVLYQLRKIEKKFNVYDPVHALLPNLSNPAACRKVLIDIRDKYQNPTDTSVYVNHPARFHKENKLTAAEINASSKELGRICRGCTFVKYESDMGFNIIEHSKRQLNSDRYRYSVVEASIEYKGKVCTFSKVEDKSFKPLKEEPGTSNPMLKQEKSLSQKRQKIRNQILACIKTVEDAAKKNGNDRPWTHKDSIIKALNLPPKKEWEGSHELSAMVTDNLLERKFDNRKAMYRLLKV